MTKAPDAFRTISEVADALETPAHVLRFWESRFPQIKPVKREGGRRYYRPADVALLTGIKRLLHDEGMTIRGVQKVLREQGVRHVAGISDEVSPEEQALDAAMIGRLDHEPQEEPEAVKEATIAALETALEPAAPASTVVAFEPPPPPAPPVQLSLPTEPPAAEAAPPVAPPVQAAPVPASIDSPAPAPSVEATLAPAPIADDPGPTLAARLRALPLGGMARRQEELHAIKARITALRESLSGHRPGA